MDSFVNRTEELERIVFERRLSIRCLSDTTVVVRERL
jgi:hypothetical protein